MSSITITKKTLHVAVLILVSLLVGSCGLMDSAKSRWPSREQKEISRLQAENELLKRQIVELKNAKQTNSWDTANTVVFMIVLLLVLYGIYRGGEMYLTIWQG